MNAAISTGAVSETLPVRPDEKHGVTPGALRARRFREGATHKPHNPARPASRLASPLVLLRFRLTPGGPAVVPERQDSVLFNLYVEPYLHGVAFFELLRQLRAQVLDKSDPPRYVPARQFNKDGVKSAELNGHPLDNDDNIVHS